MRNDYVGGLKKKAKEKRRGVRRLLMTGCICYYSRELQQDGDFCRIQFQDNKTSLTENWKQDTLQQEYFSLRQRFYRKPIWNLSCG